VLFLIVRRPICPCLSMELRQSYVREAGMNEGATLRSETATLCCCCTSRCSSETHQLPAWRGRCLPAFYLPAGDTLTHEP
jgi:hypothetical protein